MLLRINYLNLIEQKELYNNSEYEACYLIKIGKEKWL